MKAVMKKTENTFQSVEDFMAWKKQEEAATTSFFVVRRTSQFIPGTDTKKQTYYCHRSGQYKPKGKGKRHLKSQGTCKISNHCLALMDVKFDSDGRTKVVYWSEHYGHSKDLAHIHLSDRERLEIAGKLRQGASLTAVLDEVRDNFGGNVERIHILNRKDIHNIRRDFRLRMEKQHEDASQKPQESDEASVALSVEGLLRLQNEAPVLVNKEGNYLMDEDFLLVVMTSAQREMLQQFGSDKIYIDRTFGTDAYDFHLTTVLVVDEFGSGFPVAFCVSKKITVDAVAQFFTAIKNEAGEVNASVFMSNDAATYYDAWKMVMGEVQKQNTSIQLKAMHRILKQVCFEGKKLKNLDECLSALMKLSRDKAFERIVKICKSTGAPSNSTEAIKSLSRCLVDENRKNQKTPEDIEKSIAQKINCCKLLMKEKNVRDDLKFELNELLDKWLLKAHNQKASHLTRKDGEGPSKQEKQVLEVVKQEKIIVLQDTNQNTLHIRLGHDHCYT